MYIFGLGPGFFRAVLPKKYWRNLCKIVHGGWILMQCSINAAQVWEAHSFLIQFVKEFEHLYYQWCPDHLHFCQPWLHTLLHTAPEILHVGPGCYGSQNTMECAIGDLGKDIRQLSNPFANLSQIALWRSQINALLNSCPELDVNTETIPTLGMVISFSPHVNSIPAPWVEEFIGMLFMPNFHIWWESAGGVTWISQMGKLPRVFTLKCNEREKMKICESLEMSKWVVHRKFKLQVLIIVLLVKEWKPWELVMPMFSSEPWFEPEPTRTGPRFGPRFKEFIEPNLRSGSRFREWMMGLNPSEPGSNWTFLGTWGRQLLS